MTFPCPALFFRMKVHQLMVNIAMSSHHLVTCWTPSQRTRSLAPALPPQDPWALALMAVERQPVVDLLAEPVSTVLEFATVDLI